MFLIDTFRVHKTKKKGSGIFATADIPAGTVIGDYLGTMIRAEEEDEKKQGLYCLTFNDASCILANPKKVGIHLINHSCLPNCTMYPYESHTMFVARRKIFKGEELTVSYLLGIPDHECNPCTHACMCGEELCQGSMHCADAETDAYCDFESAVRKQKHWRIPKKTPVPFGKELPALDLYPATVSDHPAIDLYASSKKRPVVYRGGYIPKVSQLREMIRTTGRACSFPRVGIVITGIKKGSTIFARPLRS